ncbi:hypothetical protein HY994_06775 [Candidatus Micrarchaeota archaeon]|nr:hypothetical protein [Candidatus Micrarchaeota archaeon]
MKTPVQSRPNPGRVLCLVLLLATLTQAVTIWTGTPRIVSGMTCGANEIACGFWGQQPIGSGTGIACCTLAPGITLGTSRTATYNTYGCETNEVLTAGQFGNTMTCATTNPALILTSTNAGPFNMAQVSDPNVGKANVATCNTDAGLDFVLYPSGGTGWYGFCATAEYTPCAGTTASCGAPGSCIACTAPAPVLGSNYCSGNSIYQTRTVFAPICSGNTCSGAGSRSDVFIQTCANGCLNGACTAATPTPTPIPTPTGTPTPTPIPTPAPQACSITTTSTCQHTVPGTTQTTAGSCSATYTSTPGSALRCYVGMACYTSTWTTRTATSCTTQCPSGYSLTANPCTIQAALPDDGSGSTVCTSSAQCTDGWGIVCPGPTPPTCTGTTAGTTTTYTSTSGCNAGDTVVSTTQTQTGCAPKCNGNASFTAAGTCINLDTNGYGVCQYPTAQICPITPGTNPNPTPTVTPLPTPSPTPGLFFTNYSCTWSPQGMSSLTWYSHAWTAPDCTGSPGLPKDQTTCVMGVRSTGEGSGNAYNFVLDKNQAQLYSGNYEVQGTVVADYLCTNNTLAELTQNGLSKYTCSWSPQGMSSLTWYNHPWTTTDCTGNTGLPKDHPYCYTAVRSTGEGSGRVHNFVADKNQAQLYAGNGETQGTIVADFLCSDNPLPTPNFPYKYHTCSWSPQGMSSLTWYNHPWTTTDCTGNTGLPKDNAACVASVRSTGEGSGNAYNFVLDKNQANLYSGNYEIQGTIIADYLCNVPAPTPTPTATPTSSPTATASLTNCVEFTANANSLTSCPAGKVAVNVSDKYSPFSIFETFKCCSLTYGNNPVDVSTTACTEQPFGQGSTQYCPSNTVMTGIRFNSVPRVSGMQCCPLSSQGIPLNRTKPGTSILYGPVSSVECPTNQVLYGMADTVGSPTGGDGAVDQLFCQTVTGSTPSPTATPQPSPNTQGVSSSFGIYPKSRWMGQTGSNVPNLPLYRFFITPVSSPVFHMLSNQSQYAYPGAQVLPEGPMGVAYSAQAPGSVPLYLCYSNSNGPYPTTDGTCSKSASSKKESLGFVFPNAQAGLIPLYLCRRTADNDFSYYATPRSDCEKYTATFEGTIAYVGSASATITPSPTPDSTQYTGTQICQHDSKNCLFSALWQSGNFVNNLAECTDPYAGNTAAPNTKTYWQVAGTPLTPNVPENCQNGYNQGYSCANAVCGGNQTQSGFYPKTRWMTIAPTPTPVPQPDRLLYRCWHQTTTYTLDHYLSTESGPTCENPNLGHSDGPFGYVYSTQKPGTSPLYRCNTPGGHIESTRADCENAGYSEGVLGYVPLAATAGFSQIYRCHGQTYNGYTDRISTLDPNCETNYALDGPLAFVNPPGTNVPSPTTQTQTQTYTGAQICAHENKQCLFTKWIQSGTYTNIISDCTTPVDAQSTGPNANNYWQTSAEPCANGYNLGKSCVQALCTDGPAGDTYPKTRWFTTDQSGNQLCAHENKTCAFVYAFQQGTYTNNIGGCDTPLPATGGNNAGNYILPLTETCTNSYNLGKECFRAVCQDGTPETNPTPTPSPSLNCTQAGVFDIAPTSSNGPRSVAEDPQGNFIYVPFNLPPIGSSAGLSKYYTTNFSLAGTIPLFAWPGWGLTAMDPQGKYGYVASVGYVGGSWLEKVNLNPFSIEKNVSMPFSGPNSANWISTNGIVDMRLDSQGQNIYAVMTGDANGPTGLFHSAITKINASDLTIIKTATFADTFGFSFIDAQGQYGYFSKTPNYNVINPDSANLIKVQLSDLTVTGRITTTNAGAPGVALRTGYGSPESGITDPQGTFGYVAVSDPLISPSEHILKIRLSDFTVQNVLNFTDANANGWGGLTTTVMDPNGQYVFFSSRNGNMHTIRLSDFTNVGTYVNASSNDPRTSIGESKGNFIYRTFLMSSKLEKLACPIGSIQTNPITPPSANFCQGDAIYANSTAYAPLCIPPAAIPPLSSMVAGCQPPVATLKSMLVQTCPFGCNPANPPYCNDCRPGTNQTCTLKGQNGNQVCASNGTWGSCIVPTTNTTFCQNNGIYVNTTTYSTVCTVARLQPVFGLPLFTPLPTTNCTPIQVTEPFEYDDIPIGSYGDKMTGIYTDTIPPVTIGVWKSGLIGKALVITDQNRQSNIASIAERLIRPSTTGTVELDVHATSNANRLALNLEYEGGHFISIFFNANGKIQRWDKNAAAPAGATDPTIADFKNGAGGFADFPAPFSYSPNQWYHLNITWYGSTYDVSVNGQKLTPSPIPFMDYSSGRIAVGFSLIHNAYQNEPNVNYSIDNIVFPGCAGGCQSLANNQTTLIQTCPFGCNPANPPFCNSCRPGTNQICVLNGLNGSQICNANGTWGNCTITPSTLCRKPPNLSRFGGATTNVAGILSNPSAELKSVNNFALEATGGFKLSYRSAVNLCGQDFDSNVAFGPGFFALNDSNLSASLVSPAQPVSVVLNYPTTIKRPTLLYATGFHRTAAEILQNAQVCPATKCQNVAFVNGRAIFDAASFSDFIVNDSNPTVTPTPTPCPTNCPSPTPPPSVSPTFGVFQTSEMQARCPGGLVVDENITVSVFYVPGGVPTCVNQAMQVQVVGNNSPQTVKFQTCDPLNGQHVFLINTSASGNYQFSASAYGMSAQCSFTVVGRAPTPTPELPVWLVLVAAVGAFVAARRAGRRKVKEA